MVRASVLGLVLLFAAGIWPHWYGHGPRHVPQYGVSFSCRHAEWLGLDCVQTYRALLDDLGVRHLRLSVHWWEVEPEPGRFTFDHVRWLLDEAHARGARVVLSVGMKAQRHPEFYLPDWLRQRAALEPWRSPAADPLVAERTVLLVERTVQALADHPAIEAWQVENEPYMWNPRLFGPGRSHGWWVTRDLVLREIEAVRRHDPHGRPVVVTHSSWTVLDDTWRTILEDADILGQDLYFRRQVGPFSSFYLEPYRTGPLAPNFRRQAEAAQDRGKALWIMEFQAEPHEEAAVRAPTADESGSLTPERFNHYLAMAERSGAQRVYLWGAEWWYFMKTVHGDGSWWEAMRGLLALEPGRGERL
ncbi:MAG TPA: beta-galactosidase [Dehalococcoidia bacterium]